MCSGASSYQTTAFPSDFLSVTKSCFSEQPRIGLCLYIISLKTLSKRRVSRSNVIIFKVFSEYLPLALLTSFCFASPCQSTMLECFQAFSQHVSWIHQMKSRYICAFWGQCPLTRYWAPGLSHCQGLGKVSGKILNSRWVSRGFPFLSS